MVVAERSAHGVQTDDQSATDQDTPDDEATAELGSDGPDEGEAALAHSDTGLPPRINAWRQRSATGAMLTGFAFGLREVFEPKRDEPSIVMETSGVPPTDLPVDAEVDQIRPSDNVVTIRPWLLAEDEESAVASDAAATEVDAPIEPAADRDPGAGATGRPGSTPKP